MPKHLAFQIPLNLERCEYICLTEHDSADLGRIGRIARPTIWCNAIPLMGRHHHKAAHGRGNEQLSLWLQWITIYASYPEYSGIGFTELCCESPKRLDSTIVGVWGSTPAVVTSKWHRQAESETLLLNS